MRRYTSNEKRIKAANDDSRSYRIDDELRIPMATKLHRTNHEQIRNSELSRTPHKPSKLLGTNYT